MAWFLYRTRIESETLVSHPSVHRIAPFRHHIARAESQTRYECDTRIMQWYPISRWQICRKLMARLIDYNRISWTWWMHEIGAIIVVRKWEFMWWRWGDRLSRTNVNLSQSIQKVIKKFHFDCFSLKIISPPPPTTPSWTCPSLQVSRR